MNDLIKRSDVEKMLSSIGGCDATEEWERGWDEAIDTALNELRKVKAADRWIQPILEGLENIAKKHPYKVIGNMDSYSQYNEAWQDCIDCVERMISEVFIEHQLQKDAINTIERQPKVGEWIPCSEMLPENSKHKGAFCPRYEVNTKYGVTQGWYNPDVESWYCLFWFLLGIYDENDINFERGDIPKVVKISKNTDIVTAWKPLPEPWEEE